MLTVKSDLENYAIKLPNAISEITEDYFKGLLDDIILSDHYAIIALCYSEKLFTICASTKNNDGLNCPVVPIIAKIDSDKYPQYKVLDRIVIDAFSIERGTILDVPNNVISYSNIKKYFNNDKQLYDSVIKGDFFNNGLATGAHAAKIASPDCYFIGFRIIPIVDIKASYSPDSVFECIYKEQVDNKLNIN